MEFGIDHLIVIAFLMLTLLVGMNHGRSVKTIRDYALGGRNFSTGALIATIVATYASGSGFFITLSKTYTEGFYYLLAYIGESISFLIIALILAPRMGEFLGNVSIAEAMGDIYGKRVRFITAISAAIGSAGLIAVQFKAFGSAISCFIGIDPAVSILVSGTIVTLYSALGGIKSVTFTDILQGVTFTVVILLLGFIIWGEFFNSNISLSSAFTNPKYNFSTLFNSSNKNFFGFIVLFLYFACPTISAVSFQRISIGKNIDQVKKSFLIAGIILFLIKATIAWVPFLINNLNSELKTNEILPYIIENYSFVGLRGLIVMAIISFAMSTADSRINATSTLFTNDIYKLLVKNSWNEVLIARIFAFSLGIGTIILSLTETDLLTVIIFANSFYYPLVVPPFLLTIFGFRSSPKSVLIGMMAGLIFTIIWKTLPVAYLPASSKVVGVLLAMMFNTVILFLAHYLLKQEGGWIGIKDDSYLIQTREKRKLGYDNFIASLRNFHLLSFCKRLAPHYETTYNFLGIYFIIFTLASMYTCQEHMINNSLDLVITLYPLMLVTGAIISMYQIWPLNLVRRTKENIIALLYPVSVFYMLILLNCFFVLVSKFSLLQTFLFTANIIIASLLLGWKLTIPLLLIGSYSSVIFYRLYFNEVILNYDIFAPESILMYLILAITCLITFFLRPKQEYLKVTEVNLDRAERDVKAKIEEVDYLKFHAEFRKQELVKALDLKNEFIRNLEHEKSAPITGISCLTETLLDYYDQMDEEKRKKTIKMIAQSGARLNSYVSNMIDLSKLQAMNYELTMEEVDVGELISDRLAVCKKLYITKKKVDKHSFKLDLKDQVIYTTDRYYLTQVIDNLIINAIEHTEGKVVISLVSGSDLIYLSICDEGPGIPEKEKHEIFSSFGVSSRTRTPSGGRGVGLALCKNIIEIFNGVINVKNNSTKGATFLVELPQP